MYGYLDYVRDTNFTFFNFIISTIEKHSTSIQIQDCKMEINITIFKTILSELSEFLIKDFKAILPEILAGKEDDFNKSFFGTDLLLKFSNFMQNINDEEYQNRIFNFFEYSSAFEPVEINDKIIILNYEKSKEHFDQKMESDVEIKKQRFWITFINYILIRVHPKPFILSAERTGATMFQKELDVNKNEIVERISRANGKNIEETVFNVLNARYSRYPKPVKDNIYFVRELDEVAKKK